MLTYGVSCAGSLYGALCLMLFLTLAVISSIYPPAQFITYFNVPTTFRPKPPVRACVGPVRMC